MTARAAALVFAIASLVGIGAADAGNRLTHLDEASNPYWVGIETARLTTPQWIGEPGVEAVIVLAIDDLRKAEVHEKFLRPIFERLKQIDGRAGMSLMTNAIEPDSPIVARWLAEGANLETHTDVHPCPCLAGGDLATAKGAFDRCVDAVSAVPGARPVAYRMPCCDSMNSVSPRFFAEIFNKTTPQGRFLAVDSSVFHVFSADDPALPVEIAFDEEGRERFRKYVPVDRLMVNLVENYPYPYVIGRLCWEVPALMPSDWDAQHLNGKCSPTTVRDLKAAVDATVVKQGIFSLCFHAHGWIANDQVVEMIDYAHTKYGNKVKFLSFREVRDRIDEHLLGGTSLRADNGQDNGVRLADLDGDGYIDVVVGNESIRQTRIWSPEQKAWHAGDFPAAIVTVDKNGNRLDGGVRFGVLRDDGRASIVARSDAASGVWHFDGKQWTSDRQGLDGLELDEPVFTAQAGRDRGARLRDLDRDGRCELIVGNESQQGVFRWDADGRRWRRLPFALPEGTAIVDAQGRDAGLRFVDLDDDGRDDVVFSNGDRYSAHLWSGIETGWSRELLRGKRGDPGELPPIVRADGTNNGAWFSHRHMWVQNEDTGKKLPDHVDRRNFENDFLAAAGPRYVLTRDGRKAEATVAVDGVCAWPNLTVLPDGSIVATIFNQPSHGQVAGDVECWATDDGGRTWHKRGTPAVHEPDTNRMNVAAGLAPSGDLLVIASGWSNRYALGQSGAPFRAGILEPWVCRSSDGGRTWSVDKEAFPAEAPGGGACIPFGDLVIGADGALRVAIYAVTKVRNDRVFVYRSDDDGKTWGRPVPIEADGYRNETAMLHLGKGHWLAAARENGLHLHASTDDGLTWQYRTRVTAPAQHPGHLLRLRDGRLVLSSGNRTADDRRVEVRFSADEGQTWGEPIRVVDFEGDGGYPSSVQRDDGRVLTAYYASKIAGHARYHMGVVVWDPARGPHR